MSIHSMSASPAKPTSRTGLGPRIWDDWLWRPTLIRMDSESRTYVDCLNLRMLGAGMRRLTKPAFD